ncbi:MAG: tetratricopeptide repeat protein, partial [Planctomycetota bacterium]|nr:tetratricopeptide repeat protein [Planctomycetota bacterium]
LKPANVLVTESGQVKVLDFGIARMLSEPGSGEEERTRTGQILGTLSYMSPEQLGGDPGSVDTRSDVYTLGVIGYGLIAGQRPIELEGTSLAQAAHRIQTWEPVRLGSLNRSWRGDLEGVCSQALSKEPSQRYGSAGELANDVRRHLSNHPVLARAPSTLYRVRKFVVRNPLLVIGASALVLLSIGFGSVMAVQAQRVAKQRDLAERKNQLSWEVAEFLVDLFQISNPEEARQQQLSARNVLDLGSKRIRSQVHADPELRSALLLVMARTYTALGDPDAASPLVDEAIELRSGGTMRSEDLAEAQHVKAVVEAGQGDFVAALKRLNRIVEDLGDRSLEQPRMRFVLGQALVSANMQMGRLDDAMREAERMIQAEGENTVDGAQALALRGQVYDELGRFDRAESDLLLAKQRLESLVPEESLEYIKILRSLGDLYLHMDRLEDCEELMGRALELDRLVYGDNHPNVDADLYDLASAVARKGDLARAIELFKEVLVRDRKNLGDHPFVGIDMVEIAQLMSAKGDLEEASEWFAKGLEIQRRLLPPDHFELATSLNNLSNHEQRLGHLDRALELSRQALAIREASFGADHPTVWTSRSALAVRLDQVGQKEEAEDLYRQVLAARERLMPGHSQVATSRFNLASFLVSQKRWKEAEGLNDLAFEKFRSALGEHHPNVARCQLLKGRILLQDGRAAEAEIHIRAAGVTRRMSMNPGTIAVMVTDMRLAECLLAQDRFEEAEGILCPLWDLAVEGYGAQHGFAQAVRRMYTQACENN